MRMSSIECSELHPFKNTANMIDLWVNATRKRRLIYFPIALIFVHVFHLITLCFCFCWFLSVIGAFPDHVHLLPLQHLNWQISSVNCFLTTYWNCRDCVNTRIQHMRFWYWYQHQRAVIALATRKIDAHLHKVKKDIKAENQFRNATLTG